MKKKEKRASGTVKEGDFEKKKVVSAVGEQGHVHLVIKRRDVRTPFRGAKSYVLAGRENKLGRNLPEERRSTLLEQEGAPETVCDMATLRKESQTTHGDGERNRVWRGDPRIVHELGALSICSPAHVEGLGGPIAGVGKKSGPVQEELKTISKGRAVQSKET